MAERLPSAGLIYAESPAAARARRRVRDIREFYLHGIAFAVVIPALWIINLASSTSVIWAQWPTLGWGFGLIIHGFFTFGGRSWFGPEWEERKVLELLAREQLKQVSSEKQLVQAQLRMLQAQIEPHFLFNTLANVQMLVRKSPEQAAALLDNLIAYLRRTLTASRAEQGTLKQEFELIGHYLELIRMRMGERLRFELDLPAQLANLPLPPMLLQPLVENAVQHGLEPKLEGGRIKVSARLSEDQAWLECRVEDDGLGFDAQHASRRAEAGGGYGLSGLRERLAETVRRLREVLSAKGTTDASLDTALAPELAQALRIIAQRVGQARPVGGHLRWIRASRGDATYQIAVEDVYYFQSEDKCTVVHTAQGEYLIRTTLSELAQSLDPDAFWQVHRSSIVNVARIEAARRDGEGRMSLSLRGVAKPIAVSRAYQGLFKQM